jgi:hypothetical protein
MYRSQSTLPRRKRQIGAQPTQVLEDAEGLILADNRRCHYSGLLVLVGTLPSLPNDQCD